MAKEKNSGSVLLRGTALQGAANGFIQASLLTGLATSGNDALIVKQINIEYPTFINGGAVPIEVETAFSRASKAAMPNVFDDDVLFKDKYSVFYGAAGVLVQKGITQYTPPYEIVIIEDTVYVDFKTLGVTAAGQIYFTMICQPATVSDSEKVGLLLTRIN